MSKTIYLFIILLIILEKGETERGGGWIPQFSDHNQWLQVDFGKDTQITGVSTQGHVLEFFWVESYSLRYSVDGLNFEQYYSRSHNKVNYSVFIWKSQINFILQNIEKHTYSAEICTINSKRGIGHPQILE